MPVRITLCLSKVLVRYSQYNVSVSDMSLESSMNYIDELKADVRALPNGMIFNTKVKFIERVFQVLDNKQLPKYHFPELQLNEAEIAAYMANNVNLSQDDFENVLANLEKFDHDLGEFRTQLQLHFGYWATITQDFVQELSATFPNESFLELMAGNGYLSKGLRDSDSTAYCTDDLSWSKVDNTGKELLTEVESLDAMAAIEKYGASVDNIIMAWSPDREDIDYRVLQRVRQLDVNFLVIGERYGATDSKEFWDDIKIIDDPRIKQINQFYSRYDLVRDQLYLVQ